MNAFSIFSLLITINVINLSFTQAVCERSTQLLAAEDICWSNKVKIVDRIQYTTKSLLNFAREKLGFGAEDPYHPQQCDYYECIFGELKMLTANGYPNYDKIVNWIDNNIVYNYAKQIYERLEQCNMALAESVESNLYFSGNITNNPVEVGQLQGNCEILQEFLKCLAKTDNDCVIFKYP